MIVRLPESVLFVAAKQPGSPRLRSLTQRLTGTPVPLDAPIVALEVQDRHGYLARDSILQLFSGPRAAATSLLWALFVADFLGFFFLASWLPVIME